MRDGRSELLANILRDRLSLQLGGRSMEDPWEYTHQNRPTDACQNIRVLAVR